MEGPRYYDRPRPNRNNRDEGDSRNNDQPNRGPRDSRDRSYNSGPPTSGDAAEGGPFLLLGVHSVTEALRAKRQVEKIMIDHAQDGRRLEEMLDLARRARIPVQKVPRQALDRQAEGHGQRHQGVIAFVSALTYVRLSDVFNKIESEGREPFLICLDGVTDVRNAGAIARSAECAGADALVVPMLGTAMLGPDAMQASAGALGHIAVAREGLLAKGLEFMRKNDIKVVAVTEKANKEIYWADLTGPIALVLGSEERGISGEVLAECDFAVKLPMLGSVGSLNVANAASVAIYEVVRQRLMAEKANAPGLEREALSDLPIASPETVKKPRAKKKVNVESKTPDVQASETLLEMPAAAEKKPRAPKKPKAG
jgi:23S rRNA (guanosine2251-2'-O)-methyltransferase